MAASWRWCIGLALALACAHCAAQTTTFAYTATCAATKRFNAAALVCAPCGTNQVPDASGSVFFLPLAGAPTSMEPRC